MLFYSTIIFRVATCPGSPGDVLEFNFVLEIVLEIIKIGKCPWKSETEKMFCSGNSGNHKSL